MNKSVRLVIHKHQEKNIQQFFLRVANAHLTHIKVEITYLDCIFTEFIHLTFKYGKHQIDFF